jgi:hypothetical protein
MIVFAALTTRSAAAQPLPVPPIAHASRADPSLTDGRRALGEMPSDDNPAAQAAWRIRSYDLQIDDDQRTAQRELANAERQGKRLDHYKPSDADDPGRLQAVRMLDYAASLRTLSELDAQAATLAKAAVVEGEAVRLAVAKGSRPAADLVKARESVARTQRIAQAARQARIDKMMAFTQAMMRNVPFPVAPATSAGGSRPAPGVQLGEVLAAQERARLEAVAYNEVRSAVEAGRRPPADLEAEREVLKAAQAVVYDQIDTLTQSSATIRAKLREDTARHIEELQQQVADEERALPTLSAEARPRAEDRLRMTRELLESYRSSAALAAALPVLPARPQLPILPPRS